jgi:phosphoribosylformylglycinamidine synthase PurS subunit
MWFIFNRTALFLSQFWINFAIRIKTYKMKFLAEINVMPLKALLDPQGKAVGMTMHNIGFTEVTNVRVGKHITMEIDAASKDVALEKVNEACSKILSNPVMEGFEYTVKEIK